MENQMQGRIRQLTAKVSAVAIIPPAVLFIFGEIFASGLTGRIVLLLIGIACIVLVFVAVQLIIKALLTVADTLKRVSEGDLQFEMNEKVTNRSDEIGRIARLVQGIVSDLSQTIFSIFKSADSLNHFSGSFKDNFDSINSSIGQVNGAIEDISQASVRLAEATTDVNNEMNEMGDAIKSTTEYVSQLNDGTDRMQNENSQMKEALTGLSEISDNTKKAIDAVYHQTNDTNQSVEEISKVVDIISGIASQTNLLSLNASIEAARAGEQGRGFAVVADNVRQLAEQSQDAASHISEIVETLITKSNNSVSTMDGLLEEIKKQEEKLEDTVQVFETLNTEIAQVSHGIGSISSQIEKINSSKDSVVTDVEAVTQIAQSNAASAEETSATMMQLETVVNNCNAATNQLVDIADGMSADVGKFKNMDTMALQETQANSPMAAGEESQE